MNLISPLKVRMSQETVNQEVQDIKQVLQNKQKIRLLFPYEKNAEVKKLGAKWNGVDKLWYYPSIDGELPDELKQYKAHKIFVEYDDKEFLKLHLKSMRFDKILKVWIVNQEDYNKFLRFGGDNV